MNNPSETKPADAPAKGSDHFQVLGIAGKLPVDYSVLLPKNASGPKVREILKSIRLPHARWAQLDFDWNELRRAGGGMVANVLAFLGKAECKVAACGAVGADERGDFVREELAHYNVNHKFVEEFKSKHTPAFFIVYKPGWKKHEEFDHKTPSPAKFLPRLLRKDLPGADVMLVGRANKAVNTLIQERQNSSTPPKVSFHVTTANYYPGQRQRFYDLLAASDLIVASQNIFHANASVTLKPPLDPTFARKSPSLLVVYGGANEISAFIDDGTKVDVPALAQPATTDPTGMIDAFHGALLSFLLEYGWELTNVPFLQAALGYANEIALEKAQGVGARFFPLRARQLEIQERYIGEYRRLSGPYQSCFISHSSRDQVFVDQLYAELRKWEVRCWFAPAPEAIEPGQAFRKVIEAAIRSHDRLLVVLSGQSILSSWVQWEVSIAEEIELREDRLVLFPLSLIDLENRELPDWVANLYDTRQIEYFRGWPHSITFRNDFRHLLTHLQI